MKRHTCIICGSKRYENSMKNVFLNSWACSIPLSYQRWTYRVCADHIEIIEAIKVIKIVSNWEKISLKHLSKISPADVIPEQTFSADKKVCYICHNTTLVKDKKWCKCGGLYE